MGFIQHRAVKETYGNHFNKECRGSGFVKLTVVSVFLTVDPRLGSDPRFKPRSKYTLLQRRRLGDQSSNHKLFFVNFTLWTSWDLAKQGDRINHASASVALRVFNRSKWRYKSNRQSDKAQGARKRVDRRRAFLFFFISARYFTAAAKEVGPVQGPVPDIVGAPTWHGMWV